LDRTISLKGLLHSSGNRQPDAEASMTASTPLGFLLGIDWQDGGRLSSPDVGKFCGNLLPVTIGNMIDHGRRGRLQRERRFARPKPRAAPCLND
jgi:hypothetical protein